MSTPLLNFKKSGRFIYLPFYTIQKKFAPLFIIKQIVSETLRMLNEIFLDYCNLKRIFYFIHKRLYREN